MRKASGGGVLYDVLEGSGILHYKHALGSWVELSLISRGILKECVAGPLEIVRTEQSRLLIFDYERTCTDNFPLVAVNGRTAAAMLIALDNELSKLCVPKLILNSIPRTESSNSNHVNN